MVRFFGGKGKFVCSLDFLEENLDTMQHSKLSNVHIMFDESAEKHEAGIHRR